MIQLNDETQLFIKENSHKDVTALLLQKHVPSDVDLNFAVTQIDAKRRAKTKLPTLCANDLFVFPSKLSVEQCSSELTAKYKSHFVSGKNVADITGGLGVDAIFMSEKAAGITYIEQNPELVETAGYNFSLLKRQNIAIVCDDGIRYLTDYSGPRFDCVYADPSRRNDAAGKTVFFTDCIPDVVKYKELILSKAEMLLIKASPMLDISEAIKELGNRVSEIHIVSVKNECKELLFLCRQEHSSPRFYCVNIRDEENSEIFDFTPNEESACELLAANAPGAYLYEPNTSVMKSGAFKLLCRRFGVSKLHQNSHLYTSDDLCFDFPGRIFEITDVFRAEKKEFHRRLPAMQANITVRNYPLSVEQLKKKYNLKEGGDIYLFATTLRNNRKVMIKGRKL